MGKKLKANFKIKSKDLVIRVGRYPSISKVMESQIEYIMNLKEPPLIEQVHPVIAWLDEYSEFDQSLLAEIESVLSRIDKLDILGKESFFNKFALANDKANFNSAYSEIFLANFYIKNGIEIQQFEPKTSFKDKLADFKIILGDDEIIIELVTPSIPNYDFEDSLNYLFQKLERIQSNGLIIRVSGFESFDSSNIDKLWSERVPLPSYDQLNEIIANFRKVASNANTHQLPFKLPTLCKTYPRIEIEIASKIPNYQHTVVAASSSKTAEVFPLKRIVSSISDEKKHFSKETNNFIFVDFSYWSQIDRWFLDTPYYRNIIMNSLRERLSKTIDGVFSYILSNKKDEELINRRVLHLNPQSSILDKPKVLQFINRWDKSPNN